jgi:phage antirepressor YoqD-like protein
MEDVQIAITTAPHELSLANEVRLLKPALLYADHVTLYSPTASLFASTAAVGDMDEANLLAFLRDVGPMIDPNAAAGIDLYDQTRRKKGKTRHEMQGLLQMRRALREFAVEWTEKVEEMLTAAGADELVTAIEAGLVAIDPLLRAGDEGDDALFEAYMARLRELLKTGHAYPLLDDQTGDLVRAAVNEGAWEFGATARRRGKQVTGAARLMERLPAFPDASMHEILDIRERLRPPLVRFRAAMIEMERLIDAAAHDEEFGSEIADIYLEKVAPALQEIDEAVQDDKYLRQLAGALVGDAKTYVSGGLSLAVAMFAQVPDLVAVATGLGVGATTAAVQAGWRSAERQRQTERHQLFFLYKLGGLIESSKAA